MKTWLKWLLGIVANITVIVGIGVLHQMNKQEQLKQEIMEFAQSKEAKEAIEKGLRNLDDKVLTNKGIIKTYKVDESSIDYNPMGAIGFKVIVNNEDNLYVGQTLRRDAQGSLILGGYVISEKLSKLLGE